jgi:hypothetical protein
MDVFTYLKHSASSSQISARPTPFHSGFKKHSSCTYIWMYVMIQLNRNCVVKVILQRKSQLYVRHLQTSQMPENHHGMATPSHAVEPSHVTYSPVADFFGDTPPLETSTKFQDNFVKLHEIVLKLWSRDNLTCNPPPPLGGAALGPYKRWRQPPARQLSSSQVCEYIWPIEINLWNIVVALSLQLFNRHHG